MTLLNKNPAESLRQVHQKGGLAVAAHPGLPYVSSLSFEKINEIIHSDDPELYFDGIEISNGSGNRLQRLDKFGLVFIKNNQKLDRFIANNSNNPKLGTLIGGSDVHTKRVGDVTTAYSQDSIIDAIKNHDTMVMVSKTNFATDVSELITMLYAIVRSKITP